MVWIDNQLIYDTHWHSWEEMKRWGPMSRHARRLVRKFCRRLRFSSVLDIGCGPGFFLEEVRSMDPSARLAGVDISATAISLARKRLPDAELLEMDIVLEVPDHCYDLVTMIDVVEHIDDDLSALRNLKRVCRGHLVICTLEGRMRAFESEVGHVRNYRPGELESKLNESGFALEDLLRWGWPTYSPIYRNLSQGIAAHQKRITATRWLLAHAAYWLLLCNWPGRGDLVIALARPEA